ncbi:DUF2946 domain-containing protein [Pseudoduganella sp. RAF19]|uniref:DUF2946 domain-containing protein n=2 Tax=unclassified Pseudoduganella TaxID=2637179 RepID=UPI003F9BE831
MRLKSTKRLAFIWLACFAVLLNALAPTISHAMAFAKGHPRVWEICLNDGTRLRGTGELDAATFLALTDRSKPARAITGMQMDMEDCAYCLPHAGSTGLPPTDAPPLVHHAAPALRPLLFYQSPAPLQVWSTSNPRGPPALS